MLPSVIKNRISEDNMFRDPSTKKRFKTLYKMSPYLYDSTHTIIERTKNVLFQLKNIYLIKSPRIYADPEIVAEYDKVYTKLEQNTKKLAGKLSCPVEWAISKPAGLVIYAIIRKTMPKTVLETGVANGASTYIILSALNKNKKGHLVSTEIRKDVGQLLIGISKRRWRLMVGNPKTVFRDTLKRLGKVDIFLHDSDHSYKTMMYEYTTVFDKLSRNGLILSDDVNGNAAFMQFSQHFKTKPVLIRSRERVFGVLYAS
ncbi:MAG: class I SAM-dependent methyltransferase [Candidatus Marsarchaeota archaeon]|nr:class I SAM-dependent methyltransferase [Candidatus Marsarchaeota archaeon]